MTNQTSTLMKTVKALSYASLVVVLAGLTTVFVLAFYDSCEQLDFADVVCADPLNQALGRIGMTIMWATVNTVVPAALAIAGAFFLVDKLMRAERGRASSKKS